MAVTESERIAALVNMLTNSPSPPTNQPMTFPRVPYADARPPGLVLQGNITDPNVSRSDTSSSEFVNHGYHLETLLPTVVNGQTLTPAQVIERYRKTGQHFGQFENPDAATAYARILEGGR